MQQQQRQPSEVSAERGEIVCPFCKSVANGILPYHSHGFQELEQRSSWKFSLHGDRDQIELLFSQHQLRHDALPAFDVLVADHCLTKSQMTKRNLAFGTSGSIERNIISMRQLQALWSAIGYTLLTTITVNDDQVNQKNIIITTDQLFRCSQRANEWFPSEFNYQDMVANALRELLFSSLSTPIKLPSQCHIEELNFDAFRQLLSLQLLPVIHDSICPEDSNTLQRVFELSQFTASSSSSLWPFLRQPLFTQDLYMISIALTSNTPHLAEALDLTCLMCLARLCQLLLEPSCTGILSTLEKDDVGKKRARIPSEPSDVPFVPGELMKLRDQIYKIVGIQCHEPLDETVVIDLWVPFLQFIRALRSLIRRQVDPSAKATSCCDPLEIFGLLHDCGLTELIRNYGSVDQAIGVDSPFLNEISTIWANQYRNYYQCVDQDSGVVSVSEPAERNTDQSLLPAVYSQSEWINEVADTSGDAHDNEEGDSSDEGDEDDLEDMVDVDDDLQELANDPALLLSEDIQDVDVAEMREWLIQTGIAVNSEDIQQVLGSLDRNLTKGSLLCGVDPLETPFRTIDRPSINSNPPLVGSVSGLIPYLDSSRQSRLAAPLVDYSHLGFGQRHRIKLIDLPEKYTDLYQMVPSSRLPPLPTPILSLFLTTTTGKISISSWWWKSN